MVNSELKILLGDDHFLIRKGLIFTINSYFEPAIIDEADSCNSILKQLAKVNYSHIILDLILIDGISLEILPTIAKLYPKIKIAVFTMQPREVYGRALAKSGVSYYISKQSTDQESSQLIQKFLNNEKYPLTHANPPIGTNPFSELTDRELHVLHYLSIGRGNKQISETLNITRPVVSEMTSQIRKKTKTNNMKELLELAMRYNIG